MTIDVNAARASVEPTPIDPAGDAPTRSLALVADSVVGDSGFAQLRGLSRSLRDELLEMYFTEAALQLTAIDRGAAAGDADAVAYAAHSLKGSSQMVGAELVATLAGQIDSRARARDLRHVGKAVRVARHALTETHTALNAVFAREAIAPVCAPSAR